MRVNVYADEITTETELVKKEVGGRVRYGLRVYLETSDLVGEDCSAVTFWIGWSEYDGYDFRTMATVLDNMYGDLVLGREEVEGPPEPFPDTERTEEVLNRAIQAAAGMFGALPSTRQVDDEQDGDDQPKDDE